MNRYLKKHDNGNVDWSTEGFEMLNSFQALMEDGLDLTCRRILGDILMSRGFERKVDLEEYVLSDGEGRFVDVFMGDTALRVVKAGLVYNFPMHYESGQDELCDLWEMIRKAWDYDE